jgi:hypothetical protein
MIVVIVVSFLLVVLLCYFYLLASARSFNQLSKSDRNHATRPTEILIGAGNVPARRFRQAVTVLKPTTRGRCFAETM